MNILFILYGDFTTNTAGPIVLFSGELQRLGHECVIAVPDSIDSAKNHDLSCFTPKLYDQVLKHQGHVFSNGARPDIIHACTMRIGVIQFLKQYLSRWPAPLVVYMEDNETWISENYLGFDHGQSLEFSNSELKAKLPSSLSNPLEYPYALALADLVILIQEKLCSEVPCFIPTRVIPWGVNQSIFHPEVTESTKWRNILGIDVDDKVIVYHGGLNGFTRSAMLDLCRAIELINLSGVSCKLIRTGPNPINFWQELRPNAEKFILEAGVVEKQDLPSILALSDLYVQPGRINPFEDLRLPSKLPEFLSMGKPVVLPNVNIANLFEDGSNAIVLKVGDPQDIANACLTIFNDDKYSEKLGLGAKRFAQEHFELSSQTLKLEQAYKDAVNSFNHEHTRDIWVCFAAHGAIQAALMRVRFSILLPTTNFASITKQLLAWCEQLNARLNSTTFTLNQSSLEDNPEQANYQLLKRGSQIIRLIFRRIIGRN